MLVTGMTAEKREASRWVKPDPKCTFCESYMKPAIIFRIEEEEVRGWRCPNCSFTLIHPEEIPKALGFLKKAAQIG